tara:strand:+ start:94 stop:243 length:150 start_codon:yes stop_codon:yes gene_type:complete
MDYLLWVVLLFFGTLAKCLGIVIAFAFAYVLFLNIYDNDKLKQITKGDN